MGTAPRTSPSVPVSTKGTRILAPVTAAVFLLVSGPLFIVPASAQEGSVLDRARQQERERLQHRIGRFASGEATVYEGELTATVFDDGIPSQRLPRGRVVASLESRGDGTALTVVSREFGLWLRLHQSEDEPRVIHATRLRPLRGSPGVTASCRFCLADLRQAPPVLDFARFVATGRLSDPLGTPFRVELSGRLEAVPAGDLRLADVEVLNPGLEAFLEGESEGFQEYGGEGVRRVERQIRERVPPPEDAPPQTRCERVIHYAAERFVDLKKLGRFGVRDLEILRTEICCLDHDSHGESEQCSAEEAR